MGSFPSKFGRNQVPVDPNLPLNSVDSTRLFESIDVNRNGSIEKDEFTAALLALGGCCLGAGASALPPPERAGW